jgi:hypothetical protein
VSFKVSVIKAKLHEEIGMPAGKQKLQLEVSIVSFLMLYFSIKM